MIKGFSLAILLIYLSFKIIESVMNPDYDVQSLLFQLLIIICLFLFFLRLEKIDFQSMKLKLINFSRSGGIKITGAAIFAFLILINMVTISQKLFASPSSPNILLIVADALRPDHLGCYGYDRATSPQIDKFATNALVFENAITNAPWTKPSMGSLFTSKYPHEHSAVYWTDSLPDKCLTLAEVFKNRNYATFAIQTNPAISENHNFRQGFQFYEEIILEKGEVVTSNFNTWVKKHKKKPFFAYLHYMDTHVPYNAPKEFSQIFGLRKDTLFTPGDFLTIDVRILEEIGLSQQDKENIVSLYDGAINYFDNNFKKILDHLNKLDILHNTIIILTSDHGEEFWEHNGFAHGHTVYNEVIQVPLIINCSNITRSNRVESYVQLIDLFPTLLDMTGIQNHFEFRGNNLVASVLKNKDMKNEIFFEGVLFGSEKKGIIKDGWKLIENTGLKYDDTLNQIGDLTKYRYTEHKKGFELYNIDHDFQEKQNLIMNYPQIASKLKGHLRLFKITSPNFVMERKPDLEKKLKDLKSLGYIK
jgi:arylsulfatase A-like enzyme